METWAKTLPRRADECYRLGAPTHLMFWKDPCGIAPVLGLHSVKAVSVCAMGEELSMPLRAYLSSPLNQSNESSTFSLDSGRQGWHIYQTHPH